MSPDDTYRRVITELPAELRALARHLPFHLGLTASPEQGWGRFVSIPPNQDLTSYAAEGLDLSADRLAAFRVAHHAGGFYGIVIDRLSDGQVRRDARWAELRRALGRAWERRLVAATGSAAAARGEVCAALGAWRRGRALERAALARGRFDGSYGPMVRSKLAWICATAGCMLRTAGAPMRATALADAYHLFLCALQCRDDVADREEDRRLHGIDVATALDVSPGAMIRAAAILVPLSAKAAYGGGFTRLAAWLGAFADHVDVFLEGGVVLQDQLIGMALAQQIADERG